MPTKAVPIITITLNSALDEVLVVRQVQKLKSTFDTESRLVFPSGKGINVARTISSLNGRVVALAFVGADLASSFESTLSKEGVEVHLVSVNGATRMNTTLCDIEKGRISHIRREALRVGESQFRALEQKLRSIVGTDMIVAFGGTVPESIGAHAFSKLITACKERGARTVVDSSGVGLKAAVEARPFMIKPNVEELSDLIGRPLNQSDTEELKSAMAEVVKLGVELVVLSRGRRGLLVNWRGRVWSGVVKVDGPLSPTGAIGSGDATVGGFCIGLAEGRDIRELIRLGTACGAANALTLGPAVVKKSDVDRLCSRVVLKEDP